MAAIKYKNLMVTVFGCGYVGLPLAVALAEMGYQVMGIDTNGDKIALLRQGEAPFFEPGLTELLAKNIRNSTLSFSDSLAEGAEHGSIFINTVAASFHRDITATLEAIKVVIEACSRYATKPFIFFNRSTVPVGSNETLSQLLLKGQKKYHNQQTSLFVAYPEFLRQGRALEDVVTPQRIIIGFDEKEISQNNGETCLKANDKLISLYQKFFQPFRAKKIPLLMTTFRNAEMIKYASNAFLATKISFANEVANICQGVGADIDVVAQGMELDSRIGKDFLQSGIGFGGSCLPKDLESLINTADSLKQASLLLDAVAKINQHQPERYLQLLKTHFSSGKIFHGKEKRSVLKGKKIALWGLSFKPDTDDLRDAPSLKIIKQLQKEGAKVYIYDPLISLKINLPNLKMPQGLQLCTLETDMYEALTNADALIIATEWKQFINADLRKIHKLMHQPVVLDGRGIWQAALLRKSGFTYYRLGSN